MSKKIALALAVGVALVLAAVPAAQATINFSQTVYLKNDPTSSAGYTRSYTSFPDGYKNCSTPPATGPCGPNVYPIGGGKLHVLPRTYKLAERNKSNDYYLLDLTVTTSNRYKDGSYAYLDVKVQGASAVKTATYTLGKSTVSGCQKYPIDIAAGWGPISAGTTVGTFNVNCYSTSITRTAISGGQQYHVTNLNAVNAVTFQRFVVVSAGTKPTFKYWVSWPTDHCGQSYVSDGSNQVLQKWCTNDSTSLSHKIGTTG